MESAVRIASVFQEGSGEPLHIIGLGKFKFRTRKDTLKSVAVSHWTRVSSPDVNSQLRRGNVYTFIKGHAGGSEVILNFTTKDTFAFGGYGYSATSTPTETVTGNSDVITLSDSTTITRVGIDHKVF